MNTFFKILLVADAVVAAIALVVILVKCGKSYYRRAEKTAAPILLTEPAIPLTGKTEEQAAAETVATELADEEVPIGDVEEEKSFEFGSLKAKRRSFAEKLLDLPAETRDYYDRIDNELRSYRKLSARLSIAGESYRTGRKLVAKFTVRGKTLTFHLALNVNDFKQTVFFQKDSSDVKAYEEVPFTVKVKSNRGLSNALKLVAALAEKEGLVKNPNYKKINSVKEAKNSLSK